MPWCPKCKTEYKKGITVCVDCSSELVDEQPEIYEYSKLGTLEKKEVAEKLIKYLEYSNIISHYEYEENELGYVVYVRDDDMKKAKKSFNAFYLVELEQLESKDAKAQVDGLSMDDHSKSDTDANFIHDQEDTSYFDVNEEIPSIDDMTSIDTTEEGNDIISTSDMNLEDSNYSDYDGITEEEVELLKSKSQITKMIYDGGAYEKKSDKLKDLKSTAVTFFFFSFVGLIMTGLNILGIMNFIGGFLQYCLLTAMTVGFFIVGINSIQRAKKVAIEATKEAEDIKAITDWMNLYVTEETINELKQSSLSDEANFIQIMDGIKRLIIKEFGEIDEAFLDYIAEEYYNSKFGEESSDEEES